MQSSSIHYFVCFSVQFRVWRPAVWIDRQFISLTGEKMQQLHIPLIGAPIVHGIDIWLNTCMRLCADDCVAIYGSNALKNGIPNKWHYPFTCTQCTVAMASLLHDCTCVHVTCVHTCMCTHVHVHLWLVIHFWVNRTPLCHWPINSTCWPCSARPY